MKSIFCLLLFSTISTAWAAQVPNQALLDQELLNELVHRPVLAGGIPGVLLETRPRPNKLRELLQQGAIVSTDMLTSAVAYCSLDVIKLLVEEGESASRFKQEPGVPWMSPLSTVIFQAHIRLQPVDIALLAYLIDRCNVNPNDVDTAPHIGGYPGYTPLHYIAAFRSQNAQDIIQLLLSRNADPHKADGRGRLPWQECWEDRELAQYLQKLAEK